MIDDIVAELCDEEYLILTNEEFHLLIVSVLCKASSELQRGPECGMF